MHRHSAITLAAVATFTVAGQAFVIPPNMNKAIVNDAEFTLMNLAGGAGPNKRVLKAECKGCLEDGKDGALIYDLVITNIDSPKFLVNGADLSPSDFHFHQDHAGIDNLNLDIKPWPTFLSVPLVPAESTLAELATTDLKSREAKVLYNSYSEIQSLGDGEMVKVVLEATSVDGRPILHGATEKIEVQIIREENGKMTILDAQTLGSQEEDTTISVEDCGFFCEMLDKLVGWGKQAEEKVGTWGKNLGTKFKSCGKNAHGHSEIVSPEEPVTTGGNAPEPKENEKLEETISILPVPVPVPDRTPGSSWRRPSHSRPHYRPHHSEGGHRYARPWSHHHHHHHRPHHMSHRPGAASAMYRIFVQVLMPIAIGIVAGMLVSLMGMVVGHFAVLAYQKVVGVVRKSKYTPELQGPKDEEEVSKGLLSEEEYRDAPPEYDSEGGEGIIQEKQ